MLIDLDIPNIYFGKFCPKKIKLENFIKSSCIIFCVKNDKIFIKIFELYQVFVWQNVSIPLTRIKSITQEKSVLFLFSHILTYKNSTIFWDATLLALILHSSSLNALQFLIVLCQAKSLTKFL